MWCHAWANEGAGVARPPFSHGRSRWFEPNHAHSQPVCPEDGVHFTQLNGVVEVARWPHSFTTEGLKKSLLLLGCVLLWRHMRVARRDPHLVARSVLDLQGPPSAVRLLDTRDRTKLLLRLGVAAMEGPRPRTLADGSIPRLVHRRHSMGSAVQLASPNAHAGTRPCRCRPAAGCCCRSAPRIRCAASRRWGGRRRVGRWPRRRPGTRLGRRPG
jgi:hypothetical protein